MTKLNLKMHKRGIWATTHNGQYIDFYKLPSDGLWHSSYTEEHIDPNHKDYRRGCSTLKICKAVVELLLKEKGAA